MPSSELKQRLIKWGPDEEQLSFAVELGAELAELRWWILRVAWLPDGITLNGKVVSGETLKRVLEVIVSFEATGNPCYLGAVAIAKKTADSGNGKPLSKKTIDHSLDVLRRPLGPNAAGCDTFEPVYREAGRADGRTTYKQALWQYLIGYIPPGRKAQYEDKRRKVERLRDKVAEARRAKWELSSQVAGNSVSSDRELSSQVTGNSVHSERELSSHESVLDCAPSESGFESEHKAAAAATFDRWWAIYPRKVARHDAAKAFPKAVKRIAQQRQLSPEQAVDWLCGITESFAASPKGQAGIYCPHGATWLNGARYDDDPQEWNRDGRNRQTRRIGSGQVHNPDAPAHDPGM